MKNKRPLVLVGIAMIGTGAFFALRERLAPLPKFNIINQTSEPCFVETSETAFAVNPLTFRIEAGSSQVLIPWPLTDYFHSQILFSIDCGTTNKLKLRMDVPSAKDVARSANGIVNLTVSEGDGIMLDVN